MSGLVLPSLKVPHSGWPRSVQAFSSSDAAKTSSHVGASASQPIAAARPAGIASTMSDDPTLALSAGTLAPPPVLRAIPIHELASGIHTVGRWSSGRLWKLAAASSAARPDLSLVATTVTHVPSTSRGWPL